MFGKLEVNRKGKGFDQVREDELRIINAQRAKRCQQPTDDLDSCAGIAFFYGFFVAVKGISGQSPSSCRLAIHLPALLPDSADQSCVL